MRICAVNNHIIFCKNKQRQIRWGYIRTPDMTDEQIKRANETKRLPEDYSLVIKKTNHSRSENPVSIQIYKNKQGYFCDGHNTITNIVPDGFVLEKYNNKTYLRDKDFDISRHKFETRLAVIFGTAVFILTAIALKKKF